MKKTYIVGLITALALTAVAGVRVLDSSNLFLGNVSTLKCSTGITCSKSGNTISMVATSPSFTLESLETLVNSTDDTVSVLSEDETITFSAIGFEAKDAVLALWADQGDDATDKWSFTSPASGNALTIKNSTTSLATISTVGDWIFNGTTPLLTIGDAGEEDAGVAFDGNALDFSIQLDDSTDTLVIGKGVAAGTTDAIRIDTNQVVTFVQDVRGLGTDDLSGFLQTQTQATATTLTAAECGGTFYNAGAIEVELPEVSTVPGCRYTFIVAHATALTVDPDGADQIMLITNAAGDSMAADAIGESIVIEALGTATWMPVGAQQGTWTDTN